MDAVVLAGGYATRLWPITRHRPKMLLPVGEGTVIDRILSAVEEDDRIDTVYVSTNERFAERFERYLADTGFEKPELSIERGIEETQKLGVIGALSQLVERENVDDDMLVVAGDNLFSFDIGEFLDFFEDREGSALAAYDVGSLDEASAYGILELDGSRVVDFCEKPDDPPDTLAALACYAFRAEDVRFEEYLSGENNPDEPGWFVQWLQNRVPVHAFTFDGEWFDIGTPENYLRAVWWQLDGETLVADDATVENSTLGGNVHVMSGATVRDSELSSALVFPDSTVVGSILEESIVDHDAVVDGFELAESLVGAHSRLF